MEAEMLSKLASDSNQRLESYKAQTLSCKKEFLEKNADYGPSWFNYRLKSLLTRIRNKGWRVVGIQDAEEQLVTDPIAGEFDAIYNYGIIGLITVKHLKNDVSKIVGDIDSMKAASLEKLYEEAAGHCLELFKRKDHDYKGAWATMDISSIVDEILVKHARAEIIWKNRKAYPLEELQRKLSAEIMDMTNYGAFASILIKAGIDPML